MEDVYAHYSQGHARIPPWWSLRAWLGRDEMFWEYDNAAQAFLNARGEATNWGILDMGEGVHLGDLSAEHERLMEE